MQDSSYAHCVFLVLYNDHLSLCRFRNHAQSSLGGPKVRGPSPVQRSGANSPVVALSQSMAAMSVTSRGKTDSGSPVPLSRAPHRSELDQLPSGTPGLEAMSTVTAIDPRHGSSEELAPPSARKWSGNPVPPFDTHCMVPDFGGKDLPASVQTEGNYWQHSAPQRLHYHSTGDLTTRSLEVQSGSPTTLLSVQEDDVALDGSKVSVCNIITAR